MIHIIYQLNWFVDNTFLPFYDINNNHIICCSHSSINYFNEILVSYIWLKIFCYMFGLGLQSRLCLLLIYLHIIFSINRWIFLYINCQKIVKNTQRVFSVSLPQTDLKYKTEWLKWLFTYKNSCQLLSWVLSWAHFIVCVVYLVFQNYFKCSVIKTENCKCYISVRCICSAWGNY